MQARHTWLFLSTLAVTIPLVFALPAGAANPLHPSGLIAFARAPANGDFEIATISPATGKIRLLTRNRRTDVEPAWSPSGERLAFSSNRRTALNFDIWVMRRDGKNQRRVTASIANDVEPTWSPDGASLAFSSDRKRGDFDLWAINVGGGGQKRLTTSEGSDVDPSWSPDGHKIAFSSDRDRGNFDIYLLDLRTGAVRRVTGGPSQDFEPSWSPDGTTLAFHRYPKVGGSANVRSIRLSPTSSGHLTRRRGDELAPSWSPDGGRVVFHSRGGCTLTCPFDLWVHNVERASSKRLTGGPTRDSRPAWQPATADLAVRLAPETAGPVPAGAELVYVIDVVNRGPGIAWSVAIEHALPPGVEIASVSATRGPCTGTQPIVCSVTRLGPGGEAMIRVVARAITGGVLDLAARASSLTFDPRTRNNARRATLAVAAPG